MGHKRSYGSNRKSWDSNPAAFTEENEEMTEEVMDEEETAEEPEDSSEEFAEEDISFEEDPDEEVSEEDLPEEDFSEEEVSEDEYSDEDLSEAEEYEEPSEEYEETSVEEASEEVFAPEEVQQEKKAPAAAIFQSKFAISRLVFVGVAVLLQLIFVIWGVTHLNRGVEFASILVRILAFALVLGIYSQNKTSTVKIPWIALITAFPILGIALYLMMGLSGATKKMSLRYAQIDSILFPKMPQNDHVMADLKEQKKEDANLAAYVKHYSGFPVYDHTDVVYYKDAAEALEAQKEAMRGAKKFIFIEYHAIDNSDTWKEIQDILEQKVQEGVEVRIFYDDADNIFFINPGFIQRMEALGIRCRVFNPVAPVANLFLNNRDHRKLTVVDGEVGFTGGYNLTEECFNVKQPYGYYKDTGIKLTGDAVRSLTVIFLEMWNAVRDGDIDDRYCDDYLPPMTGNECGEDGFFVQPYADSPLDIEPVAENVYISLINSAKDYVWFVTPYLTLTDEMVHVMGLASKRGVDVRIITPGISDKKLSGNITRSYYYSLIRNGVRIYEFTPGFCHAKMCIADGRTATIGTIDLDYRCMYHHFENGVVLYGGSVINEIRADFEDMFRQSMEVTDSYGVGRRKNLRIFQIVLRFFAPLL